MPVLSSMKTAARNIILFFIFLHSITAYTQTAWIDSVKKVLPTQKEDTNKVNVLNILSNSYADSYADTGLAYAQQALDLAEKLNYEWGIWESEISLARSLTTLGNYPLSLNYSFKALALAKKLNNLYAIGWTMGALADCYYNLGEYNTSLRYERELLKIAEQSFKNEVYHIWINLSRGFESINQHDSAILYAKKGYETMKRNQDWWAESYVFLILGNAFAGKANYDSALVYYRMSIPLSAKNHLFKIGMIDCYNGIAQVYKAKGKLDSAVWYAKMALTEKMGKSYPNSILKATSMLADIYELQNKPDSTLKYLRRAISLKDSLFNREKIIAIQNLTYKDQEKQRELEAARSKLQREYLTYFLIALLVIAIIITAIIVRNKRIKQLQNIRNNIAADLHDDIGSTLTNISILSELSRQSINPEDNAGKFLTRITEEVNTTSQALDDIIWSVNVHNDSMEEILLRMRRYSGELFDTDGINYTLDFDDKLSGMKISMEQRHDFYLIFKEAMNNIYKHANASFVSVSLSRKDRHIMMRIEDNGKGITEQNLYRNGLKNMKSRAERWGGNLHIESGKDKGTVLLLLLPAKK